MTRIGTGCGHHRGGHRRRYPLVIALASMLLVSSACSPSSSTPTSAQPSSSPTARAQRLAAATGGPLRAASPWLLMQDSHSGTAVWPSGAEFLLLHTVDGWRHVTNITPVAVPTGGGLSMSARSRELVVAVLPFHQLVISPILRSTASGTNWSPGQLPGGLTIGRQSIGIGPRGVTAVLRTGGGTVVEKGPGGWSVLTDASRLAGGRHLQLDAISWGVGGRGWVTGHGPAGGPVAFTTKNSGTTWAAVVGLASDAVAALTPCGRGQTWMLPVVRARGTMSIARSVDGGATWATGAPLTVPLGLPVWGCHAQAAWMMGSATGGDHVYSSGNAGRTWTDHGVAPDGVTDLEPTGNHTGFATTTQTNGAILWAVRGDGAFFSPMTLPGWVGSVGNQMTPMN